MLSVFPGSPALRATAWRAGHPGADAHRAARRARHAPPGGHRRGREVLVVATGRSKAAVLGDVFGEVRDPARWPAQLARRDGATWILDRGGRGDASRGDRPAVTPAGRAEPPTATRSATSGSAPGTRRSTSRRRIPTTTSGLAHGRDAARPRDLGRRDERPGRRRSWPSPTRWSSSCTSRPTGSAAASARACSRSPRSGARTASISTASRPTRAPAASTRRVVSRSIAEGDGSDNEERQPDIRYAWRP